MHVKWGEIVQFIENFDIYEDGGGLQENLNTPHL